MCLEAGLWEEEEERERGRKIWREQRGKKQQEERRRKGSSYNPCASQAARCRMASSHYEDSHITLSRAPWRDHLTPRIEHAFGDESSQPLWF